MTQQRDGGFTLIEVVVSTTITAFCMAMFTAGLLQIYRVVNDTEATSTVQSQLNIAFQRLDKEIRYAAGFSTPGTVGDDSYVEYLSTGTGTATCTQLRLHVDSGQLQRRVWAQGSSPAETWTALASSVSADTPFAVSAADETFPFQRLRLRLTVAAGTGSATSSTQLDVTFTALNTALGTASASVCAEGRPLS